MQDLKQRAIQTGDRLLDVEELAIRLNVSKTAVYRMVERRLIPFHRIPAGLRFSMRDVGGYLERCRVNGAGDTAYGGQED